MLVGSPQDWPMPTMGSPHARETSPMISSSSARGSLFALGAKYAWAKLQRARSAAHPTSNKEATAAAIKVTLRIGLTTIRRKPVSPISAVPQEKLWTKRKYQFGFVGIEAGC